MRKLQLYQRWQGPQNGRDERTRPRLELVSYISATCNPDRGCKMRYAAKCARPPQPHSTLAARRLNCSAMRCSLLLLRSAMGHERRLGNPSSDQRLGFIATFLFRGLRVAASFCGGRRIPQRSVALTG